MRPSIVIMAVIAFSIVIFTLSGFYLSLATFYGDTTSVNISSEYDLQSQIEPVIIKQHDLISGNKSVTDIATGKDNTQINAFSVGQLILNIPSMVWKVITMASEQLGFQGYYANALLLIFLTSLTFAIIGFFVFRRL